MGLLTPSNDLGYLHGDAPELDRKLREGDGLAWQGDPALWLQVGVLTAKRPGFDENLKRHVNRGDIVARRYEVWRHTEQGEDVMIGHWKIEEFDKILFDLVSMDPRSRGHVPVEERLLKAEAAKEKEESDKFRDAIGPMLEHQMLLAHDTANPKTKFRQVGGFADSEKTDAGS